MKRIGYLYDKLGRWENIVEAERACVKRKKNHGVLLHERHRMANLVEIQQNVLAHRMETSEYSHMTRVSGQDKVRHIAKLKFHPCHIQNQLVKQESDERINKALVRHTYASRKGYGQTKAALRIKEFLRKHRGEGLWYSQNDIRKYYESIPHALVRRNMERMIKDKDYINAFMEPFEVFSSTGKGVPLGIPNSQTAGNVALMSLDRLCQDKLGCMGYTRYLDDFIFFGKTKGEVKRKTKIIVAHLEELGFDVHSPKIHRVSEGVDMLGFVYNGTKDDMFWRKSNKKRWLRRRSRLKNKKRIKELDDAAWGMLKWGNRHCKRLFYLTTGNLCAGKRDMGIKIKNSGLKLTEKKDANGVPFFDAPNASMAMVLGKTVIIKRIVEGINTSHGKDRMALQIEFLGGTFKLFVNASGIKSFCRDMIRNEVTRFSAVFIDRGAKRYDVDIDSVEILEVDGREIEETDGIVRFKDTKEIVTFN